MASLWSNLQCSLSLRLFLQLLPLVLTVTTLFSVTESAALIQLRGEVGGNVTFRCTNGQHRVIKLMYLQRGQMFINGYYKSRNITKPTWKNTIVDHIKATVHMYSLNISHSGEYHCYIQFDDNHQKVVDMAIQLSVTATYSKPVVTKHCHNENHSCLVTCASHGGYPSAKMMWKVSGTGNTSSQMWTRVNSSEVPSPSTMLFSSSSTTYFNCSRDELKFSCSVANSSSEEFSVCAFRDPPDTSGPAVIAAAICAVVFILGVIVALCWKCKTRQRGEPAAADNVPRVWGKNQEITALTETLTAS